MATGGYLDEGGGRRYIHKVVKNPERLLFWKK